MYQYINNFDSDCAPYDDIIYRMEKRGNDRTGGQIFVYWKLMQGQRAKKRKRSGGCIWNSKDFFLLRKDSKKIKEEFDETFKKKEKMEGRVGELEKKHRNFFSNQQKRLEKISVQIFIIILEIKLQILETFSFFFGKENKQIGEKTKFKFHILPNWYNIIGKKIENLQSYDKL